jgi:hypothetical protein
MVGFSSLWILGLVVILTTLGFADHHANVERFGAREVLCRPGYRVAINAALALVCLGQLGWSAAWWQKALWGLLALAFVSYVWSVPRERRAGRKEMPADGQRDRSGLGFCSRVHLASTVCPLEFHLVGVAQGCACCPAQRAMMRDVCTDPGRQVAPDHQQIRLAAGETALISDRVTPEPIRTPPCSHQKWYS